MSPSFSVSSDSDIPLSWQVALQGAQTAGGPAPAATTSHAPAMTTAGTYAHPVHLGRLQPVDLSIFNRNPPSGSSSATGTTRISPEDPHPHPTSDSHSHSPPNPTTHTTSPNALATPVSSNSSGLLQLLLTQFVALEERMEAAQEEMRSVREEMRRTREGVLRVLKDTSGDMREMAIIAARAAERIEVSLGQVQGQGGEGD